MLSDHFSSINPRILRLPGALQPLQLDTGTPSAVHYEGQQHLQVSEGQDEHAHDNEGGQPQPHIHVTGEETNFDVDVENVDVDDVAITALLEANAVSQAASSGFDAAALAAAQLQVQQASAAAHSAEFADVALEVHPQPVAPNLQKCLTRSDCHGVF